MNLWLILSVNSVTLGGLLFLLSAGFSLIFGLMRIPNLTHGSMFMLGAYFGVSLIAAGTGFWLAALYVRYRDINYLVAFVTQILLFLTPIAYGASAVPERLKWVVSLNPMTGVIVCCVSPTSGHPVAAPPSSAMTSRRLIILSPHQRRRAARAAR